MDAAVLRYRVMAYVTGTVLIVLCFVGIPLQVAARAEMMLLEVRTARTNAVPFAARLGAHYLRLPSKVTFGAVRPAPFRASASSPR